MSPCETFRLMVNGLKTGVFATLLVVLGVGFLFYVPTSTPPDISGKGCLVLVYHRVVPRPFFVVDYLFGQDDFTVYDEEFRDQIRSVKSAGGTFIRPQDLDDIVRRRVAPPPKCVLLTLDDADISQYRHAFPILKSENVPFLVFVITGQVGSHNFKGLQMATWPQL